MLHVRPKHLRHNAVRKGQVRVEGYFRVCNIGPCDSIQIECRFVECLEDTRINVSLEDMGEILVPVKSHEESHLFRVSKLSATE